MMLPDVSGILRAVIIEWEEDGDWSVLEETDVQELIADIDRAICWTKGLEGRRPNSLVQQEANGDWAVKVDDVIISCTKPELVELRRSLQAVLGQNFDDRQVLEEISDA